MRSDQPPTSKAQGQESPRIETQIHRRKKAKAFSALELEWDQVSGMPPSSLRMSSDRMESTTVTTRRIPHK